jgi:hypothetical protein
MSAPLSLLLVIASWALQPTQSIDASPRGARVDLSKASPVSRVGFILIHSTISQVRAGDLAGGFGLMQVACQQ